jgi:hypothetical protein
MRLSEPDRARSSLQPVIASADPQLRAGEIEPIDITGHTRLYPAGMYIPGPVYVGTLMHAGVSGVATSRHHTCGGCNANESGDISGNPMSMVTIRVGDQRASFAGPRCCASGIGIPRLAGADTAPVLARRPQTCSANARRLPELRGITGGRQQELRWGLNLTSAVGCAGGCLGWKGQWISLTTAWGHETSPRFALPIAK